MSAEKRSNRNPKGIKKSPHTNQKETEWEPSKQNESQTKSGQKFFFLWIYQKIRPRISLIAVLRFSSKSL